MYGDVPVAWTEEQCISNAEVMGWIPRECMKGENLYFECIVLVKSVWQMQKNINVLKNGCQCEHPIILS